MEDFEDFGPGIISKPRRNGTAALIGAGMGIALAAILAFGGFWQFLVAVLFAVVGGMVGRLWVGER